MRATPATPEITAASRAVCVAACLFFRAAEIELLTLLLWKPIMPLTPLLGRNQPSIAVLVLLITAKCSMSSTGTREFPGPFAHLDVKHDHSLLTPENRASDIQELTLAQLNAWSVVPRYAEFAGKSGPHRCKRTLSGCKSQRRANSLRICWYV